MDINDHYVRGTHRPHLVMDVHDSGAARGVAGAYQVRIDDAEPVVEGEQRAADLHVVRLFLQSRSGVRVVCPFCVLRCRLPATPCESREENYILRRGVSSTTTLIQARRDEERAREQQVFLPFGRRKFRRGGPLPVYKIK